MMWDIVDAHFDVKLSNEMSIRAKLVHGHSVRTNVRDIFLISSPFATEVASCAAKSNLYMEPYMP